MNDSERHDHIFVLTGPVQGGKTTLVSEKITLLREKGVKVMGFLCPGSFSEGKRSAFSLVDLETGRQVHMGDAKEQKGWVKFRRFFFRYSRAFDCQVSVNCSGVDVRNDHMFTDFGGPY